ncbi:hereditary hemochromatosis protein homolog isoform X3 [Sminthopsis crassicaudata]|uniref:hereditary hemochromatosis protein homolog isoform X3 n=1 Tax=Sminthopsis crassicaudata TaxID=9301 RepID=UPI003D69734B
MTPGRSYGLLFLVILWSLANAQSHVLQYNIFGPVNLDGEPHLFSVLVYLNDELFLYYDSKSQMLEPRGTWLDRIMDTVPWETENRNLKEIINDFSFILEKATEQSNQNTETVTWEAVHPAASSLKNAFEAHPVETRRQKAKLVGDYGEKLRKYLKVWNEEKGVFPSLNLTQSKDTKQLKCGVYNFFPRDIKITWYGNGSALSQRDQEEGIIQPSGDGTYQTWVSMPVYFEKSNYTCYVEHHGRNQSISIYLGPVSEANRRYGIPPPMFLLLLYMIYEIMI